MSMNNRTTKDKDSHKPARIKSITIEGFRSLKNIKNLELPQLAILIGANGAGKSTFIRFFEMLGWMLTAKKLQEFVALQGGGADQFFMGARQTSRIHAEISLETSAGLNDYRFDLNHAAEDTVIVKNEAFRYSDSKRETKADWRELVNEGQEATLPILSERASFTDTEKEKVIAAMSSFTDTEKEKVIAILSERPSFTDTEKKTARTITGLLRNCITYQFHDTSEKASIRMRWDVSDNFRLRSDGGNLAPILLDMKENDMQRYQLVVKQIQRVLPIFKEFVLEPVAGKILLRWQGQHSDKVFGVHLTSDGSLRIFCLITLLNLPHSRLPNVMFFDEPELGLHPHAITLVAEMLKRLSKNRQIFVATQSPYMVDCFDLENIIVAENKQGETSFHNLSKEEYQAWLDDEYSLSEIWLKTPVGDI